MSTTASAPRDFGFGEDETMLRDMARKLMGDRLPPDLLDDAGDPHQRDPRATLFFADREPGPAELDDLLPQPLVPARALPLVVDGLRGLGHQPAQGLDGQALVEELARQVAKQGLVFSEAEVSRRGVRLGHRSPLAYFDFGRPSTRSPRMLRWISFVPAAMVPPYEFM